MTDLQIYVTLGTFVAFILLIAFDVIDMTIAALLGVGVLIAFGIMREADVDAAFQMAAGTIALLFGGMVVARVLATTGLFDSIGDYYLRASGGSGRRFLLLLLVIVAPVCAVLPNATTVVLLAPIIIRVARALDVDFVGPVILTAIVSNAAGMLTLVGDPATFLVGSSIGMTFGAYLQRVSLGGLLAVLVVVPLLPWLMHGIWNKRVTLPAAAVSAPLKRPGFALLCLAVLMVMVALFIFGEQLPSHIVPPAVAIIAAALALLVLQAARIEPAENVLRDVDWKTLIFLAATFCLVQALNKTGLLNKLAFVMADGFGHEYVLAALALLVGIGLLSTVLANTPVVAAMLVTTKGYLVAVEAVPDTALAAGFTAWPDTLVPVFIGMMFGATLGGNATLIGSAANLVGAGVCATHGEKVTFVRFMRLGLPITAVQLTVGALYVFLMF